jgi:hypothetical protein
MKFLKPYIGTAMVVLVVLVLVNILKPKLPAAISQYL